MGRARMSQHSLNACKYCIHRYIGLGSFPVDSGYSLKLQYRNNIFSIRGIYLWLNFYNLVFTVHSYAPDQTRTKQSKRLMSVNDWLDRISIWIYVYNRLVQNPTHVLVLKAIGRNSRHPNFGFAPSCQWLDWCQYQLWKTIMDYNAGFCLFQFNPMSKKLRLE